MSGLCQCYFIEQNRKYCYEKHRFIVASNAIVPEVTVERTKYMSICSE